MTCQIIPTTLSSTKIPLFLLTHWLQRGIPGWKNQEKNVTIGFEGNQCSKLGKIQIQKAPKALISISKVSDGTWQRYAEETPLWSIGNASVSL